MRNSMTNKARTYEKQKIKGGQRHGKSVGDIGVTSGSRTAQAGFKKGPRERLSPAKLKKIEKKYENVPM